ncbi:MAG: ISL3 family transposase [Sporichthyaceae bacterium]|nr:ISL3 family transposase [Sporichthyaceae bacterium]
MRHASLWKGLLRVEQGVLERMEYDSETDTLIFDVRLDRRAGVRCGRCRSPAVGYDQGRARPRCWRGLDVVSTRVLLRARVPRVRCPEHGVTAAAVPWARHGSRFTRAFEDTLAWLATRAAKTTIAALMRTSWRSVGQAVTRVVAELDAAGAEGDRLVGLSRIGIDEVSYRRGHKYLTVVVDHDTGRLVFAGDGRTKKTLGEFFNALGEKGCANLELVSCDGADWIAELVGLRAPQARLCLDPFHVIATAQRALDKIRTGAAREARRRGNQAASRALYRARFALWKNPDDHTDAQAAKLAWVAAEHDKVHKAWQLKEHLRAVFAAGGAEGLALLDTWYRLAETSGLPAFTDYARRLRRFRNDIANTLHAGLANARVEGTNTVIRLLTRVAFGFHSPEPLIALAKLRVGGYHLALPR